MNEAILIAELGFSPSVLDDMSEDLIQRILIYRGVKNVMLNGGSYL
jgi:hypothetical protein